jgi:hypothetical protein
MQSTMNTKVRLTLRNPLNEQETHTIDIIPKDAPIGDKWIEKIRFCLDKELKVEKNFCWVGFPDSPRNLEYLIFKLNGFIKTINDYNADSKCCWERPYYITEDYRSDNIITADYEVNHELFNKLHHHFEVLQGQVWNISDWFVNANNETRYAIRQLNNLCHEMEILIKQMKCKNKFPQFLNPSAIIAFINGPREELELEDHEHFTLQRGAGRVFLGYCQIGKIHWEAFVDGDQEIFDSGISGLKYVSGEITIDFGAGTDGLDHHQRKIAEYAAWLESHGLSIDDVSLAHGWLHVATVNLSPYDGMTSLEIEELLSKYLDIYKISVIKNDHIVSEAVYDYHWNKESFEQSQKIDLFESYKSFCKNTD